MKVEEIKTPRIKLRGSLINWAAPIGCGLLFLFFLRYMFFVGYVPSVSMEPVIKKNSFIFGIRIINKLERGDIIIFKHEGSLLIKRIVALYGDKIAIGEDILIVPENCCYVLGDNRLVSIDSRHWDEPFVPLEWIVARIWPIE